MNGDESIGLTYHGLFPPEVAIVLGIVLGVGVIALYLREHGRVGPLRRILMALIRIGVVGTALFLLMRPVLVAETQGERPRGPALLIDNTFSLSQRDQRLSTEDRRRVAIAFGHLDPGSPVGEGNVPATTPENPARSRLVEAVLDNKQLDLLNGLERTGPLQVYVFGQRLRNVYGAPSLEADPEKKTEKKKTLSERIIEEAKFEEIRTALADAIHDVLNRGEGDPPSAIVVFTDGRDNESERTLNEAAKECKDLGIPLHIYGVGSSEVGNLVLKDVKVPKTVFFDDTVTVPVRWRARGFTEGGAEIVVTLGDRVVARKDVAVREGEDFRDVLSFVPRKTRAGEEERTTLRVEIRHKGEETFTDDNAIQRPISLVDRKVKLLFIENTPRWEYKFLMTALLRDRRVEARFLLAGGDRRAMSAGPPYVAEFPAARKDLFEYDLVILGDVPARFLGPEKIRWIRDFVREGGSLIMIAGREHAPSSYHKTDLAEVLPVEFSATRPPFDPLRRTSQYSPVLTRFGERAEMLQLADTPDENRRLWQTLPGFTWFMPVSGLRPGAVALLVHPRRKAGDDPAPILATHFYGKGQAVYLATDETWRWRYNVGDKYFGRFWGQVIYQMGLPHLIGSPKRVQLALERPDVVTDRPVQLFARVFDAEYRPYTGERVQARLTFLDAGPDEVRTTTEILERVSGQKGEYRTILTPCKQGRYVLKVIEPAEAELEYRVGLPPLHEMEVAGMAAEELAAAARISGGTFYREEDLHTLARNVESKTQKFTVRQEELLWNWQMLLLFVGLITLEWILRKFANLS